MSLLSGGGSLAVDAAPPVSAPTLPSGHTAKHAGGHGQLASSPFEAVRQRADVPDSIRHGECRFVRPEPSYEVALDLFRMTN